jgi:hypothetical protein
MGATMLRSTRIVRSAGLASCLLFVAVRCLGEDPGVAVGSDATLEVGVSIHGTALCRQTDGELLSLVVWVETTIVNKGLTAILIERDLAVDLVSVGIDEDGGDPPRPVNVGQWSSLVSQRKEESTLAEFVVLKRGDEYKAKGGAMALDASALKPGSDYVVKLTVDGWNRSRKESPAELRKKWSKIASLATPRLTTSWLRLPVPAKAGCRCGDCEPPSGFPGSPR